MLTQEVDQSSNAPNLDPTPRINVVLGGVNDTSSHRRPKKSSSCNDLFFALIFLLCVGALSTVAGKYSLGAFSTYTADGEIAYDYSGFLIATFSLFIISLIFATLSLISIMFIPEFLIKVSMIFSIIISFLWSVMAFITGHYIYGAVGSLVFLAAVGYAKTCWQRIPFAVINLVTAAATVKKHVSVIVYAYLFAIIAGGWSVVWALAYAGVYDSANNCDDVRTVCTKPNAGYFILLLLILFYGQQIFQHSVHVCVAGTVGTWWDEPEDSEVGYCESSVYKDFLRAVTTSFGSICLGSLLVAVFHGFESAGKKSYEDGESGCLCDCIRGCLTLCLEYFNKWSFVYVGIYGASYIIAGKRVFQLFRKRGWEAVIADDLVGSTLLFISLAGGAFLGVVARIINDYTDLFIQMSGVSSERISFSLGFCIGLVITSVLVSAIGGAANAVIVCFAEAPENFERNHPTLSQEMRAVWNNTYPGSAQPVN